MVSIEYNWVSSLLIVGLLLDESDEDGEEEESGTEEESKDLPKEKAAEKLKELDLKDTK